ncbi:MAG: hypothetical protein V8T38_06825, partial [Oscillospiraceae bacterium]
MYVIYCQSGKEMAVVRQLAEKENHGVCSPPTGSGAPPPQVGTARSAAVERICVPLNAELTPDIWQVVKFCYGTLHILSRSQLSPTEEEYIRFLCNDGHALGISR